MLIEITLRQCKYMSFQREAHFMTCMYSMLMWANELYISWLNFGGLNVLFMNLIWLSLKCKHQNNVSFNRQYQHEKWSWDLTHKKKWTQRLVSLESGCLRGRRGGWLQELVLHHLPHCLFRDSRLSLLSTLLRCSYAPSAAVTMATSPTDLHKTMEGDLFVWSISMTQRHLHHCQPRSQSFWKYDWT